MRRTQGALYWRNRKLMTESKMRRLLDRTSTAATLISEGCKIKGTMTGTGDYLLSGHFDGDCDLDGSMTISNSGLWTGSIRANSIIISGTVEGDVNARGKVEINNTARISGAVTGDAIAVAEGAIVQGAINTTGSNQPKRFKEKRDTTDAD